MDFTEASVPQLRRPVAMAGSNMVNLETPTVAVAVGVGIGIGIGVGVGVALHKGPVVSAPAPH